MTPAKTLISLALLSASLAGTPALADPIASKDAVRYVGETATVYGRATLTFMPSGAIYIDLDGRNDSAPLSGYISRWNRPRFQDMSALNGKEIALSGRIDTFRGRPEIVLQDPGQIAAK